MSIKPPSDIVLDVARAADPARYQEASSKLSAPGGADPAAFAEAVRVAGASIHMPLDPRATLTMLQSDSAMTGSVGKSGPYQQFEAFVLRQFVEKMMPDNAKSVFGKGNAGGFWKSMLAEQIGSEVTKAGGLGIARILAGPQAAEKAAADKQAAAAAAALLQSKRSVES
ncbi:MAG: rod-binding protein [Methylobacterium sp.]|uniref:rod-binding protein n=1 Tax=Methylobacterium sp. TaxID=409 RepID=UPI0025F9AFF3|nr:rod-binding protein [Methylobacterium sp.]MBX9931371.1 rod-binding protein [Methylobacterium sp.]